MKKIRTANSVLFCLFAIILLHACSKKSGGGGNPTPPAPGNFIIKAWNINGIPAISLYHDVNRTPSIRFLFSAPLNRSTVAGNVVLKENGGTPVNYSVAYENGDSTIVLQPSQPLAYLSKYIVSIADQLKSPAGGKLTAGTEISFVTSMDSSRKFPIISDDNLLTLVQRTTFKYFWDFAHPVSGLARNATHRGKPLLRVDRALASCL